MLGSRTPSEAIPEAWQSLFEKIRGLSKVIEAGAQSRSVEDLLERAGGPILYVSGADRVALWWLPEDAGAEWRFAARVVEKAMSPDGDRARLELRRGKSAPVIEALAAWMSERLDVLPQSPLGKAIGYAQNQWAPLTRFLEDGRLEIDNNAAERTLRPVAVGRKNWLFAGSERGANAAATFFTLIESAQRNGVNPFVYLRDILERLPSHPINRIDDLLPDRWESPKTT